MTETSDLDIATAAQANAARWPEEVLSFRLGQEEYGIEILKVQEIRGYDAVTRLAGAPEFIKGVINLRGVIIPIIDLRIKFGLDSVVYDEFTVVVVLNVSGRVVGVVVDAVSDVLTLSPADIKPAPQFASTFDTRHLTGIVSVENRMLILVDIERLLLSADMALIDEAIAN